MKARLALLTACLAVTAGLLAAPAPARAQSEEAAADFTPWSGYWWPHKEGRIIGPLTKYDNVSGSHAAAWEAQNHPKASAEGWSGFCHAWSAACVLEKEPKGPISYKGQTLTVADQKAWLTVSHSSDSADFFGKRNNDPALPVTAELYQDLKPDMLWRYLKLYVQQRGIPLVMDIEAGTPVWNYPVYAYRITWAPQGAGGDVKAHLTLWMADDAVQPDQVGTKVRKHDYDFVCRMTGGNVVMGSGKWIGASIKDHPDFAWYPQQQRSENPEVKYDVVAQALKLSPIVRANSRKEPDEPVVRPTPRPNLVADVENPPHTQENGPVVPTPPALTQGPATQEKVKVSTISASDLLVLIANKTSSFDFYSFANGMEKINKVGDPIVINGSSAKDGYLYLFLIHDTEGDVKLLFPIGNQDNRVFANKKYEFGGPDDKTKAKFTCSVVGAQRIKALVTSRPLTLTGLNMSGYQGAERCQNQQSPQQHNVPEDKNKGQSQDFSWHPTQQEQFKEIVKGIASGAKKLEWVQEMTGVDPKKQLGEFAQAEAAFFVQAAGGKPGPDKPSTDKPPTDKPPADKPPADKPKIGTDDKPKDKPNPDKPSTDKPSTDKPSTDKPSTDKPNPDKPKDKPE
jgi:hypothetical protein